MREFRENAILNNIGSKQFQLQKRGLPVIIKVLVKEGKEPIKSYGETFTVYTKEARVNGRANADIIRQLSIFLNISEERIKIVKGLRSRKKIILIQ